MASDTAEAPAGQTPAALQTPTGGGDGASGETGIYVYSVIETDAPRTFGRIGIGGRGDEVYTIHHRDLAAVVSQTPLMVYDPTRENALAHERVNEVIIEQSMTPVPMSFGTVFRSENDVVEFLADTYDALHDVLQKMAGKLEYGLKVTWDRDKVLAEIERENEEIRRLKAEIESNRLTSTYFARMQLGRLVEQALADKSLGYVRDIYEHLRAAAVALRPNKVIGDKMILNGAFLVERDKTQVFDERLQEIARRYDGVLNFRQSGPWAPYNFVTIRLQLERSAVV